MSTTWYRVYEAHFGKKLTDQDVADWEEEIAISVRNLRQDDIILAVRRMAEASRLKGGRKYAPVVGDVVTEIIKGKFLAKNAHALEKMHAVIVPDNNAGPGRWQYVNQYDSDWMPRINRADPVEAWNIICEPCHPDHCRDREAYAKMHGIHFIQLRDNNFSNHAIDVARKVSVAI